MKQQDSFVECHWTELFGNKFSLKLHSKMLTNVGFVSSRRGKLITQSSYDPNKQLLLVTFDKRFVIEWLIIKVIKPLKLSKDDLIELIEESYNEYAKTLT